MSVPGDLIERVEERESLLSSTGRASGVLTDWL